MKLFSIEYLLFHLHNNRNFLRKTFCFECQQALHFSPSFCFHPFMTLKYLLILTKFMLNLGMEVAVNPVEDGNNHQVVAKFIVKLNTKRLS